MGKRLFLSTLCCCSFLFSANSQVRFAAIPELSTGWAQTPDFGMGTKESAFHLGVGATIGVKEHSEELNANVFVGAYVCEDAYIFSTKFKHEDVSCTLSSYSFGANALARHDNGLTWGATVGYKLWSSASVDGDDYDIDMESNITNSLVSKLKVGYGWKHVLLLLEGGTDGGAVAGLNIAFPIYKD
ncbi:MAG: hypothetical protein IK005_10215 [Paludibacteraceae bacterium]|nr:hypothetical protein [Paludibacteraceae bacterium]